MEVAVRHAVAVTAAHGLSVNQEKNLLSYLEYILAGPSGFVNVDLFVSKLVESKEFTQKFTESEIQTFEVSESGAPLRDRTLTPLPTDIYETAKIFCEVLSRKSKELGKLETSYYLNNYTGYGIGSLQGLDKSRRKLLRFTGLVRRLAALPNDGFWALDNLLRSGELPTVEDMY